MKWPSIDATRAYFQIFASVVLIIVLVYMLVSGKGDIDQIIKLILALMAADKGINGLGLASKARQQNGDAHQWRPS